MQALGKTKGFSPAFFSPIFVLLLALLNGLQAHAEPQIGIDGNTSDWQGIASLPLDYESELFVGSLAGIEQAKVTQDSDFIFVFLRFGIARPGLRQASAAPKAARWDDYSYVELDREGDGLWDYRTLLVPGKRPGLNNMTVLSRLGAGAEGRMMLFPEGHKRYAPLGPRAYLTPDGRGLEMRIPRKPLGLNSGTVYLRFLVRYRDAGAVQWNSNYLPAGDGWLGLRLDIGEPEGVGTSSHARQREPVAPRSELEEIVTSRYSRGTEEFVVPVVTPKSIFERAASKEELPARGDKRKVRPVLIIDASGAVLEDVPRPQPQTQTAPSDRPRSVVGPE